MSSAYNQYKTILAKHADLEHSLAVLSWDKEVNAPPKGIAIRGRQIATLSSMAHELVTSESFGNLLKSLKGDLSLNTVQKKNILKSLKNYERNEKLSSDFVERRSKCNSAAYNAWVKARKANDYQLYAPALQQVIDIKREEAQLLGFEDHPYDALMESFEPGARVADLDQLFESVKAQLVEFAAKIKSLPQVEDHFLYEAYNKDQQWELGLDLLKNMGYDFDAGRQDISPHPFTTSFGSTDVRVTTRVEEKNIANMVWSCIHEGGHALYEQGLPIEEYGLPSGKFVSLGIHESQSRLWENNVGRSLSYWKAHYPKLQQRFEKQLGEIDLETFYKGINKIVPSPIRTEADEIHYHFHILIRYEMEKAMIEGNLNAEGLDQVWNQKYKDYLGIDIKSANKGILQDIHWAYGSLGYFPTYSLGSFYAAQFYAKAQEAIPNLAHQISEGNNVELLKWLRENIHQYGQQYSANELCVRITGEPLNFNYFMKYAEQKFGKIYDS